jgi:hypothetical protein
MIGVAKRRKSRLAALAFLVIVLFIGWYAIAANYDYGVLAGVYVLDGNGERCVLDLRSDRSFTEELVQSGHVQRAVGTWSRYGQAHVSFSHEFLMVSGQELNGTGQAHGEFDKRLGLIPVLTLAPLPGGPKFRKRLLGNWWLATSGDNASLRFSFASGVGKAISRFRQCGVVR